MSPTTVYILAACRTPIGTFQGQQRAFTAQEMGTKVIIDVLKRASIPSKDVDEVIMGQVLTAGQGQNPARQSSIRAGLPCTTPAYTINMLCGSGLKSVYLAYQSIRNEDAKIIVAGGQESMSQAQHTSYIRGSKLGSVSLADTLIVDGLTDNFHNIHMGNTAEIIASEYSVSRQEQDMYALESQQKCSIAVTNGHFHLETISLSGKNNQSIQTDEFPKPNTTIGDLEKLRAAFQVEGSVTAGNSSGINDGAAAVVLIAENEMLARGVEPMAKIVAFAQVGCDPKRMGLGPIGAIDNVLKKAKWSKDDVDVYELNEAFAAQSIVCIKRLELPVEKVNITGGAIALGHPIGASGARILVTLLYNLQRLGKTRGVAGLCIGGGMGIAVAVEICQP